MGDWWEVVTVIVMLVIVFGRLGLAAASLVQQLFLDKFDKE